MGMERGSYYQRYRHAAWRFAIAGALGTVGGLAISAPADGVMRAIGMLVCLVGVLTLAIGGASLLSHNAVKAFSRQCVQNPTRDSAEGLLEVLSSHRKIRLSGSSVRLLEQAISRYANTQNADAALVDQLVQTGRKVVVRRFF